MKDNSTYTITSRMNFEQKEKIEATAKKLGISISATVKILVNLGIKTLDSI